MSASSRKEPLSQQVPADSQCHRLHPTHAELVAPGAHLSQTCTRASAATCFLWPLNGISGREERQSGQEGCPAGCRSVCHQNQPTSTRGGRCGLCGLHAGPFQQRAPGSRQGSGALCRAGGLHGLPQADGISPMSPYTREWEDPLLVAEPCPSRSTREPPSHRAPLGWAPGGNRLRSRWVVGLRGALPQGTQPLHNCH